MRSQQSFLYITDEDIEADDANVISIPHVISDINDDSYTELKRSFSDVQVDDSTSLPLLDLVWKHVMLNKKGALIELVLVYEILEKRVTEADPEYLLLDITTKKYRCMLTDLTENCNVEIREADGTVSGSSQHWFQLYLSDLVMSTLMLVYQFIWVVVNLFSTPASKAEVETAVFPYPGRESSTAPVIEKLQQPSLVIRNVFIHTKLLPIKNPDHDFEDANSAPINSLATPQSIRSSLRLLVNFWKELLVEQRIESSLNRVLVDERGHDLEQTVHFAVTHGMRKNIRDFVLAIVIDDAFRNLDCSNVVVGGNSPRDRAFLYVARKHGRDTYYIPHSIVHPRETMHPHHHDTTMFVAGEFDKTYLETTFANQELPTLVPAGRPYLQQFCQGGAQSTEDTGEQFQIMIATQDDEDRIRREFVTDILHGLASNPRDNFDIIVKIHPNESSDFYTRLFAELDLENLDRVTINEGSLKSNILSSDMLVTINSNVGVESMLLGTPCVCVNKWSPIVPTYPYASKGPVPVLTNKQEVLHYFTELTLTECESLRKEQREFANQSYLVSYDIAEKIAAEIE